MSENNWQKVFEIFERTIDLPLNEREKFLDSECGGDAQMRAEVEAMLKADAEAEDFIESPIVENTAISLIKEFDTTEVPNSPSFINQKIGVYRLKKEIGRGGMGAVFLAERDDGEFKQKVAIKLIKRGMDSDFIIQRFRNERQILAQMRHPNVAHLFDGGTTEAGSPYFIMEFIEGESIYKYCDDNKLNLTERLQLFQKICSAIEYAHEKQIIHRDIKPSNILVTSQGNPKLLDFGISKILNPEFIHESINPTGSMMRLMTPDYASPEQVRGDKITFSSDIYSLGVLLYELLTGHRPFDFKDKSLHEISNEICETPPIKPSEVITCEANLLSQYKTGSPEEFAKLRDSSLQELKNELSNNLDNILLKALNKKPENRYQSVKEFSKDISRHLNGQKVTAPQIVETESKAIDFERSYSGIGSKTLAILPFKYISFSQSQQSSDDFLGIGLADALITRFSSLKGLAVRPTSSVVRFDEQHFDPVRAGKELDVQFILDGHLKKFGNRLRVTIQLLDVAMNSTIWADTIDETIDDVFGLEDSISQKILNSLTPHLTGEEQNEFEKRGTDNPKAYEAYLRGRFHWHSYTVEGISKALVCYYEAIAEDENFALAYSGIADYYNFLSVFGVMSPEESFPAAKEAAEKAISLDKNLAEAYTSLGITAYGYDWDFQKSKEYLEKSLQLKPNSGEAHLWYGYLCGLLGDHQKAIRELEKAESLNPQSPSVPVSFALTLRNARQFEKGLAKLERALTIQPNNPTALQGYCWFVNALGNFEEAEAMCKKAVDVSERQNLPLYAYGYTLASAGKTVEARKILDELKERQKSQYVPPIYLAMIHTALGESDKAFEYLDKCFEVRDFWVIWLPIDPRFDELRKDKRFDDYCRRIHPASNDSDIHQSQVATKIYVAEKEAETKPIPAKPGFLERHKYKFAAAFLTAILLWIGYATGFIAVKFGINDLSPEGQNQKTVKRTMAILPMKNETGDPQNDFLCDGLSENLINRLSYLSDIQIAPRSASFKYKSSPLSPQQIGQMMNVETVLSGKLTRHDDEIEITAELIDSQTGKQIWFLGYNVKDSELIILQNKMTEDVAKLFKKMNGDESKPVITQSYTENPKAFELYLQGEFYRQKATPEGTRKAIELYKQALDLDANYALAYQGMALAYRSSPAYGTLSPNEAYPLAKESAMKALTIDPTLGTAYVPLASIKATYDWDFAGAEKEYQQAIQFSQNNSEAHFSYGNFLVAMGRADEGLMQLRIAQQLDPQSTNIATNIGWALYIAGRFDEAEAQIKQVLARDPNFARAYMNLGEIYEEQGKFDEAIANFQKSKQLSGDVLADMALGHAYAAAGRKKEALKIAIDLEAKVLKKEVSPFLPAVVYAGLDEKDKAFYWLERAFQEHSNWLTLIKIGRRLKLLHNDPRFDDLLKRIGFQ